MNGVVYVDSKGKIMSSWYEFGYQLAFILVFFEMAMFYISISQAMESWLRSISFEINWSTSLNYSSYKRKWSSTKSEVHKRKSHYPVPQNFVYQDAKDTI